MKRTRSYQKDLIEDLKDLDEAQAYLNEALAAGDTQAFLLALRNVVEAQGGVTKFSKLTKLNRVSLYKMLSKSGNPEWGSVMALLKALGVQFQITGARKRRKAA